MYSLQRLHLYTGDSKYWDTAFNALTSMQTLMSRYPLGFGHWLGAAAFAIGDPLEIAIAGDLQDAETQDLLEILNSIYQPFIVSAVGDASSFVPLLSGRTQVEGKSTAYICRKFACELPISSSVEFKDRMDQSSSAADYE